jgi:hypothetical protein
MNERIAVIALAAAACIAIAARLSGSFWKPLLLGLWYWLWS